MKGKPFILFLALLPLLTGSGCTRVEQPTGTVTIHFSAGELQTRALGNGSVEDGGGIACDLENGVYKPDLKILIYNSSHELSGIYPDTSQDPKSSLNTQVSSSSSVALAVKFTDLEQDTYTVYAVANTGGLWMSSAPTWSSISENDLNNLIFTALTDNNTPTVSNSRMPLSASASLSVNANGSGLLDLELKRCVAKVEVSFRNLTEKKLTLTQSQVNDVTVPVVSISPMNPAQGYLFAPSGSNDYVSGGDRPLILTSSTALVMQAEDNTNTTTDETVATLGPLLVFPSAATQYLCNIRFHHKLEWTDENEDPQSSENDGTFLALPVHDDTSSDITEILRNKYVHIVITISEIGNNTGISFNFEVSGWNEIENNVTFD